MGLPLRLVALLVRDGASCILNERTIFCYQYEIFFVWNNYLFIDDGVSLRKSCIQFTLNVISVLSSF